MRSVKLSAIFVSLALLSQLHAQQPQRGYAYPVPLYQQANINSTLNLSQAQMRQLSEYNTRMQRDWQDRFNKAWAAERDRDAAIQQLQTDYNQAWMKGTNDIFNETQRSRYNQLWLQSQGPGAFMNADIQRRLELTPEQRRQLADLNTQYQRQYGEFRNVDPTRREGAMTRWEQLQKETNDKMRTILNDQQQKTWSEMTGESFKFSPPFGSDTPRRP